MLEAILRGHFRRDALGHVNPGRLQRGYFIGVICNQPDRRHAHVPQDPCRQLEFPAIRLEAQLQIRFHGIQPLILQFVGAQLRHQPNAAPLLLLVDQNARTRICDLLQRQLQLQPTVAAQRMKHIAGHALRMNPHQRRRSMNVAHHQRHSFFLLSRLSAPRRILGSINSLKAQNAKIPRPRWEIRIRDLAHRSNWHASIIEVVRERVCHQRRARHPL